MSISVVKAVSSDFEKVFPLLLGFKNPRISKEQWRQIFIGQPNPLEDYVGFMLMDGDEVVGFFGLFFALRRINNEDHKFANLTSWIIREDYRGRGLGNLLMDEVVKLENYTLTSLTPVANTFEMMSKRGFKRLETHQCELYGFVPKLSKNRNPSLIFDACNIAERVNDSEKCIIDFHSKHKCSFVLLETKQGNILIVLSRVFRKRYGLTMPFARVLYASSAELFEEYIDDIRFQICAAFKVVGTIVEHRFLTKKHPFSKLVNKFQMYRSDSLSPVQVDTAFSEIPILGL